MSATDLLIEALVEDAVRDLHRRGEVLPVSALADEIIETSRCSPERRPDLIHKLAWNGITRRMIIEFRNTYAVSARRRLESTDGPEVASK